MKAMLFATAAFAAVIAAAPAAAATNFTVNSTDTNVTLSNVGCLGIGCSISVSEASFSPFSLSVGGSETFDLATFSFSGLGVGTARVNATLAFTDPFAAAATAGGNALYVVAGGLLTGGGLSWTNGFQTLTAANGTQFSVRFNNLAGLTTGSRATSTVTVSLLAAAVPEPATWGMMLLGFGMVAGAARYRRAKTAVTYA